MSKLKEEPKIKYYKPIPGFNELIGDMHPTKLASKEDKHTKLCMVDMRKDRRCGIIN